jgi:hypothetical protein
MAQEEHIREVARELGIALKEDNSAVNKQLLIDRINELVQNDFQKLVYLLYRIDVSESKLKQVLSDNPAEDAGIIIASLMIERQAEKIKSRQKFSQQDNDIDENEKW